MRPPEFADFARPRKPCDPGGTMDFADFADFAPGASKAAVPMCKVRPLQFQPGDANTVQAKQDLKQKTCIAHQMADRSMAACVSSDAGGYFLLRHGFASRCSKRSTRSRALKSLGRCYGSCAWGQRGMPSVTAPAKNCERLILIGCMERAVPRAESRPFVDAILSFWRPRTRILRILQFQSLGDECVPKAGCVTGKQSIRSRLPSMRPIGGPRPSGYAGNARDPKHDAPRREVGIALDSELPVAEPGTTRVRPSGFQKRPDHVRHATPDGLEKSCGQPEWYRRPPGDDTA